MNIFEIAGFEILGKLYEVWMEYPNVPIRNKFAEHGFYVYADRIYMNGICLILFLKLDMN